MGLGERIVEVANGYARLWLHQTEVFDALQAHAWILILTFLVCLANSPNRIFDGFLADRFVPIRKSVHRLPQPPGADDAPHAKLQRPELGHDRSCRTAMSF